MATLLITAFEPFDGTGLNSSLETLRAYLVGPGRTLPSGAVATAILPVAYDADTPLVEAALAEHRPAVILHLGQTGGEAAAVERIAVNLKLLGEGPSRRLEEILPGGPAAYRSTWPVPAAELAAAMRAAGCPAAESAHAGTYLCNHVLYRSLHRAAASPGPAPAAGFLHLPRLPEQAQRLGKPIPTLPLPTLVAGLSAVVGGLMESLSGGRGSRRAAED
jgi:pyroglutamyl-peptidase